HGDGIGPIHAPRRIREDARSVDDDLAGQCEFAAGFEIGGDDARHASAALFERLHARIVEKDGVLAGGGLSEVDDKPCVIELAIIVDGTSAYTLSVNGRQHGYSLLARVVPASAQ